jgi:hypothetical protein
MSTKHHTHLHVRELNSGREWMAPIRGNAILDLERRIDAWVKAEFCGELRRSGGIMRGLDGDFYARIIMDHHDAARGHCWDGAGFYLESTY